MSGYAHVIDRADSTCSLLSGDAREQGRRVVVLCRELSGRPRWEGRLLAEPADASLRLELGRLVESLARGGAKGIPLATLGRAALADLAGDVAAQAQALRACDENLTLAGL